MAWLRLNIEQEDTKMKSVVTYLTFAVFLLVAGPTGILLSQNTNTGEIRGIVTDQSGAVVPGVEVTFTNVLTGVSTRTSTNASGIYDAPTLLSGTYSITFSKNGFETFIRNGITLGIQVVDVDAKLSVGAVSQQITVTAATPSVQTATAESSTALSVKEVYDLPNLTQEWYSLGNLLPGTAPGVVYDYGGVGSSVNGSAPFNSSIVVNGSRAMFTNNNPDVVNDTPLDYIAELKADTNSYSARYGLGSSVFNVITKTGTNQWHGSLFELDQNTDFNARNFFEAQRSPYHWNQFGGTVGGPIKHNKAFFFFSYQDMRQVEYSPGLYTVPTASEEAGDFSSSVYPTVYNPASLVNGVRTPLPNNTIPASDISPFAAAAQQSFPTPNLPGLYNNYFADLIYANKDKWIGGSVQIQLSPGNQLSIAPNYSKSYLPFPSAFPTASYADSYYEEQHSISDTWTIKPSLVNDARITYDRATADCIPTDNTNYPPKLGQINPTGSEYPNMTIEGFISTYAGGGTTCTDGEGVWGPSDVVTIIKGHHILNMGGQFDRLFLNQSGWGSTESGSFTFSGTMTANPANTTNPGGLGYADFLYGLPQTWSTLIAPVMGWRSWDAGVFIEDDYKIRKDLTLNLGLRYGMLAGWSEVHNRLSDFDPNIINPATNTPGALWYAGQDGRTALEATNYHGFQPRIGFAWSPHGNRNWAVRGAYGIFDQLWDVSQYVGGMGQGWDTTGYQTSPNLYTPIFSISPPTSALLADYPTLTQGPPLPIYPSAETRTASLLNGTSIGYYPYNAPVPYVQQAHFDIQHQLPDGILVDVGYVWTRGIHLPWVANFDQVPENLLGPGNAELREPYPQYTGLPGNFYDGVSNYNALEMTAKRKFANGLLFTANYTWSKAEDTETVSNWHGGDAGLVQNSYNAMANYGLGNMDMPNIFNLQAIYELPVGRGKQFVNRGGILNGVIGGWQLSGILWLHSGSPFTPTMGTANLSGSLQNYWYPNRIASGTVPNPSISEWFNPAAFVEPTAYTFGDSGRNILLGPSYKDLDLSLSKSFPIRKLGEAAKFQVRADATDLLNQPNFGFPNSSIGTAGVGVISTANTYRQFKLCARLTF
jgi:hypothetical protein